MLFKMGFFFFIFAMIKAITPRYRYDQLMRLGWKVFLPFSLVWVVLLLLLRNLNFLVAFMLVIWWEAKLAKIDYSCGEILFLADVWQGMKLGLKYFFAPKTTINYL